MEARGRGRMQQLVFVAGWLSMLGCLGDVAVCLWQHSCHYGASGRGVVAWFMAADEQCRREKQVEAK